MNLQSYNSSTILPAYNDGFFNFFRIKSNSNVVYPDEFLEDCENNTIYFTELSVSDSLKITSNDRRINISKKIRIYQNKNLNSNYVLKIKDEYYKIYNIYHFTNKDGFPESDITLVNYEREVKFETNLNEKR